MSSIKPAGARENYEDLLFDRSAARIAPASKFQRDAVRAQAGLRGLIKLVGTKLRECREFAILREVKPQRTRHLPHGFDLRVAADAAHSRSPTLIAGRDAAV